MKKLLITGFDAFGGSPLNPSWMAVEALPEQVGQWEVKKLQIPTVFGDAAARIFAEAESYRPDVVLSIGLAGGRSAVTPERIAVNIRDARITDNAGNQPRGEFVDQEGPAAYFATVPVEKMAQAIRDGGIAATVSNSAGAFVCNDTFYCLLHRFNGTTTRAGFIHVPYIPELGEPSMPLGTIVKALELAIEAL